MKFPILQPAQSREAQTDEPSPLLFSPSEIYHENSKLHPQDQGLYRWIGFINNSPHIRRIISSPASRYQHSSSLELPTPPAAPLHTLADAIVTRRSTRAFSGEPLTLAQVAQLCYLGNGVTGTMHDIDGTTWTLRAAPSGGAMFPIELSCIALRVDALTPGIYAYDAPAHRLSQVAADELGGKLAAATYTEEAEQAALCLVLSATFQRTKVKYGERGYRFALLEAGHIAQNLLLAAQAMGLGAVPIGGFMDDAVNAMMGCDGVHETVVYMVLVGGV